VKREEAGGRQDECQKKKDRTNRGTSLGEPREQFKGAIGFGKSSEKDKRHPLTGEMLCFLYSEGIVKLNLYFHRGRIQGLYYAIAGGTWGEGGETPTKAGAIGVKS